MGNPKLASRFLVAEVADKAEPEDLLVNERHQSHHLFDVLAGLLGHGGILGSQGTIENVCVFVERVPAFASLGPAPIQREVASSGYQPGQSRLPNQLDRC